MPSYTAVISHCSSGAVVKNLPVNAGKEREEGSIPGLGRSPEAGNGDPLQYSCLRNPVDRGAWRAIVHGAAKGWAWLSNWHTHTGALWQLGLFTGYD